MEYYLDEQLRAYFEGQIDKLSSKKIAKLRAELDERRAREVARIDEEVRRHVNLSLGFELKELKSQSREDINLLLSRIHLELMQKREALVKKLFDDAITQIKAYVSSPLYAERMQHKLRHLQSRYPECKLIFMISATDVVIEKIIQDICPTAPIHTLNSIKLGGFTCYLPDRKIQIDETLDRRLEEKKSWFYEQSKLFVKE